mmetsp:Transcript_32759/g.58692  ORF Transcript_32759/g.58692 Transcript_32759/m.58692 type:complete len:236 (-) Transcript_32759:1421-2128(-)
MATSLTPRAQLPGLAPTCPSGSLPLDERCADDNEQESTPCPSGTTDDSYAHYAAGALSRFMFYPSLAYNILRSTIQPEYRWYTEIVENLLLGALPFQSMLDDFKQQGIQAVVTLNEDFELFVTSEHYKGVGIEHLHLPTVDFLFAPDVNDMERAVAFIHDNVSAGKRTYVHCKAGRGRSATVVVCYMVRHKGMTPEEAVEFVREKRPQISLASGQWTAVLNYYQAFCIPEKEDAS